jgi:subtilisin family serine protease
LGGPNRTLVLKVATAGVAATVAQLHTLPWVTAVVVPGDNIRAMGRRSETNMRRGTAASTRRRTAITPWGISDAHADLVGSILGNTGSGVHVAFIDYGADCTHPDLSGRIAGGKDWTADSLGYCRTDSTTNHGTAVAGVIAAAGTDVRGMAPSASLYSYRVCGFGCSEGDVALAIRWAKTHDAIQVINLSIGDCGYPLVSIDTAITNAIAEVVSAGIIVVAAAGDGTSQGCGSPHNISTIAGAAGAIAVTGFDDSTYSTNSSYFSYTSGVLLSAAGNAVLTDAQGGGTDSWHGSSFSAPVASGAAALILAQGFSYLNVLALLEQEAHHRGSGLPNNNYGYGSVDALASAAPTPQIFSFTSTACNTFVIYVYNGPCDVQPVVSYGLSPFKFYWHFQYGSSMHADIYDTTTTASETFPVPDPGFSSSYYIELDITVADSVSGRRRTSVAYDSWVVCPDTLEFSRVPLGSPVRQARVAPPPVSLLPGLRLVATKPTSHPSFQGGPPPPEICP